MIFCSMDKGTRSRAGISFMQKHTAPLIINIDFLILIYYQYAVTKL